jgi:restriction system protein
VYDPFSPPKNDTYNIEESKPYDFNEFDYNTKLFLLPTSFVAHSIETILSPLPPKELPKVPALPPLQPSYVPDWYAKREKKEFYFKNPNWAEKAKTKLDPVNYVNQLSSLEEYYLINNLVLTDESIELTSKIEEVRASAQQAFRDAATKLEKLRTSLEIDASLESNCKLVEISNQRHYLPSFLKRDFLVAINPESQTLLVQFEFPDYSSLDISTSQLKNGNLKYLTASQKKKVVKTCLYSLIVRAGYIASRLNLGGYYQSIVINVEQNWFDPATGQPRNGIIASLQAPVDYFKELDLSKLDPEACFKNLKGLATPSLENVSPIRPIFVLNKEDERFVQSKDLDDRLMPESNLAAMEWEDFEHLVAQLFEWEFGRNGVEVKVTRASRDRGVDAVLFDPDPLRGGKYVLQAKRYTRTVDVSSVRDLYGTVMNEGANRGILITTASFGPDSYEFAKDKPISLVDGPNLLLMLQRHGKKFRIDLEEARAINNSNS